MPQNTITEIELRHLAATPYQIINPGSNKPIIGIFQDSLLGSYRFTRKDIHFTPLQAMNLLMMFPHVQVDELRRIYEEDPDHRISNFHVLSQIMPPLTLKYKTGLFDDAEDAKTSNNVLEIRAGQYLRGQLEKGVFDAATKGILHRICNDFGNMACADFNDNMQNVVTEYMKTSSFSVGISDLIADRKTNEEIITCIKKQKMEVQTIIDKVHLGIFENKTANSNAVHFEQEVSNILNKATEHAGKIGKKSLSRDNRFLMIVESGSKGNLINISQMVSCLGQQSVDGKRISYGFDDRTLPHFKKYDDSPNARGFVENSYITGLSAPELFFHAMAGRTGLIDTAVKSVTRETPIVIIQDGKPLYTAIGDWIDRQLDAPENASQVQRYDNNPEKKNMELLNLDTKVLIPTTDDYGNMSWGELTAVTRHDPSDLLYEVVTQSGRKVTVAESESLLVWDAAKQAFLKKNSPDVAVGDYVPVTANLPVPPVILNHVNMTEYLPKTDYIYGSDFHTASDMMRDAMEGRGKIPAGWWKEHNGREFTLPYTKKASVQRTSVRSNTDAIQRGYIYPYHAKRNNYRVPEKFELNEENGIFIGLFLAEGNVSRDNITITNNHAPIQSFVQQWFDKHGIEHVTRERINRIGGKTSTIVGGCSVLAIFLTKWVGHGAANKHVPDDAFIAPDEFVIGILNGYFSGDGTISKKSVEVGSASERLIEGISMLCSRLGIFGKIFKTQLKKNNLGTKNILPTYRLAIRAQWGHIFAKTVPLLEENKQKKLQSIMWGSTHRNFPTFNDVVMDAIVSINPISSQTHPKLYDVTVPGTFNFGLANGLQVRDTSSTGYIQRRLVKGLEDLMVNYDMTVRNNKGKIIQFQYGDDNFDATKVENQILPLIEMTVEDMYMFYDLPGMNEAENNIRLAVFTKAAVSRMNKQRAQCKEQCLKYTERLMEARDLVVEKVFASQNEKSVRIPIAFQYIIANIQGQLHLDENSAVDITPLEAFKMIESYFERICAIPCVKVNRLIEIAYYYYLTPRDLLIKRRFHEKGLRLLLETIVLKFKEALVHPGEMVGVVAAQGCGEPTTQLSILRTENIKVVRVNKKTQVPEMVSGEIGTLCDRIIAQLPEYTFDTGHQDSVETVLEPLEDEYYIVGVDEKERTHWNRISHVSRHIVNGDMIRVKTRSGRVVDTTMSHSHLVRKDQSVQPILGSDMTVGMRIPVAKHIDNAFVRDSVAIADHIHVLDREFGWFVGAYLAEGCLVKKKGSEEATGTISISNVSEYYIQQVGQFAGRFGRTCRTKSKTAPILGSAKSYTNADTSFTFKPLADFLMRTCGTGSFKKRVPDFAFLAPDDFKAGLLAGYMDGDGNFMCDKLHHQIRVCSRSEQLIKDVSLLFGYLDIFGSLHTGYRNGANYYHLAISPKYAETYEERIGSHLHADKLRALVDYTKRTGVHSLREDTDRINGLGEVIAACGKTLELPGQSRLYRRWLKKDAIGRNTLEKYIQEFEQHDKADLIQKELAVLKQAAYSHVVWDEIVEIERYTPDQTEYVYDFTVPGNQTFMTDYGVVVHNTLNSVIYEEEILVRNSKKEIMKVQIGDFTKTQSLLSQKVEYMSEKDTTYAELAEYYEVPCATEDGCTVWRRIEAVTQHPVINEDGTNTMLKVTTKEGRQVTATKAKSFLQLIDGKIQGVNGKDLKVGDYLPCSIKTIAYASHLDKLGSEMLLPTQYTDEIEQVTNPQMNEPIPNMIDGIVLMQSRDNHCPDMIFDPIVSIEEVPNTSNYAYDLTVEETRTFDLYNGLCLYDTFHNTGVASKTGVTRGVPRIEEILRLTKNPKNPSMTVFMNPQEEMDIEKVNNYAVALTHTKLIDVVQSVQVYFDPMEQTTQIEEDRILLEQFYQFEEMVAECLGEDGTAEPGAEPAKSKWVIRMEIDKEILIEKNLTMDDIHFAVANSHYGKDVHCVFSDYNMDKLVFRIRTNANIFDKKPKRGVANPLDQSDEIYLLKNFQDALLNQIVLRGIHGVKNVLSRKLQNTVFKEEGKYVRKDTWVLDSTGSNLLDTLALDFIDATRTTTNDIKEVFDVLGIEAARKCIHTELVDVMAAAGASINYHHTSLLCDRMTCNKDMVSIFRSGLLNDNVGPIAKATFEVHTEVFLDAARHAEFDHMKGVSANIMCGQQGDYGTNAFQVVLDMKSYESLKGAAHQRRDVNREIEEGLVTPADDTTCGPRMEIQNNIASIRRTTDHAAACLDDGYDIGF